MKTEQGEEDVLFVQETGPSDVPRPRQTPSTRSRKSYATGSRAPPPSSAKSESSSSDDRRTLATEERRFLQQRAVIQKEMEVKAEIAEGIRVVREASRRLAEPGPRSAVNNEPGPSTRPKEEEKMDEGPDSTVDRRDSELHLEELEGDVVPEVDMIVDEADLGEESSSSLPPSQRPRFMDLGGKGKARRL